MLYVVLSSLAKGRTSAEFHGTGAQRGIDPITSVCKPNSKKM